MVLEIMIVFKSLLQMQGKEIGQMFPVSLFVILHRCN